MVDPTSPWLPKRATARTVALAAALLLAPTPSRAAWVAFNDHTPGPSTAPNVAGYNLRTAGGGRLRDQGTGVWLAANLLVTNTGNPIAVRYGATPRPDTPAWTAFHGFVDFGDSGSGDHGSLLYASSNQSITLTFAQLDPARRYRLRATALRGGVDDGTPANDFARRWTLCSLAGATSFVGAHSAGCVTGDRVPASGLLPHQVAFNSGKNQEAGEVVGWDEIAPGPGGSFSLVQTQYWGAIAKGTTARTTNGPGYAVTALRLEETTVAPLFGLTQPTHAAAYELPIPLAIAAAGAGFAGGVTQVVFSANGVELGRRTQLPAALVWTNPVAGSYRLSAIASDDSGGTVTAAVVTVRIRGSLTGPGTLSLVLGSDTAIWNDGTTVDVYSAHPHYPTDFYTLPGSAAFQAMDPVWRGQFRDSFGQPVRFTWWLMGGNIYREADNLNVPLANTMVPYLMRKYHGEALRFLGDELSLHYHTFLWSDTTGEGRFYWNQAPSFAACREDFDLTLAQYLLEEEIFPVSFRSGWHYLDNEWQAYLDQLLPFGMHNNWPAVKLWSPTEPVNNVQDWSKAPSAFIPYHPATNDYQRPGTGRGWNLRSVKMPNLTQSDVDAMFSQAYDGADQVACLWTHLPESFLTSVAHVDALAHAAAKNYPTVKFHYATAVEGMQRWLKATPAAPPELEVTELRSGPRVTLSIRASRTLFQPRPFVAVRDVFQRYTNLTALCVEGPAANSWTVTLPVERALLAKVGLAACDPEGNQVLRILRFLPDDAYVDNLDAGYTEVEGNWASTAWSAWGTDARVAWLTNGEIARARWTLPVVRAGRYTISAQIPAIPNLASNVTWIVRAANTNPLTVPFPSGLPTGRWVDLATLSLAPGRSNTVELTVSGDAPGGFAVADAIRIVPAPDPADPGPDRLEVAWRQNRPLLQFTGVPGFRAQLERSADLTTWTPVSKTEIPASGRVEYLEAESPRQAAFYRATLR